MQLFNDGWEFCKQKLHTTLDQVMQRQDEFYPIGIPHDWLIYQSRNLYEDGCGWYRKKFHHQKKSSSELVILRFDGIYMDSRIYINEKQAGEWKYGYTTFEIDITEFLMEGENEIYVSVTYQAPNSRWYTGAGIYRNVWLKTVPKDHIVSDGIYVVSKRFCENKWKFHVETEVQTETVLGIQLSYILRNPEGKMYDLEGKERISEGQNGVCKFLFETEISDPQIWDVDCPACYKLEVLLKKNGNILQEEYQTIGFRTIEFIPEKGLLLNGRKLKLNGVCEHHDLGCLGAAFHKKAMKRKMEILKQMGVNALRLAHNMPAPEVMELADRMGILIVSEAFDMWISEKNPYDYARFFKDWYQRDLANWIKRDRNHPSILMWSIGNEIYDTHASEEGQIWCKKLAEGVHSLDPEKNAVVTIASNYMPWENAQKCADIIKIVGYNYGENYYAQHHEEHPQWVIYGSETGSIVQSRGIYHFPMKQSVLSDIDEQCSSLGNSTTSWGAKSVESCILSEIEQPYSSGQFVWSGFDFIGEPTPYHTRNSYFGQVDTAGFPKDSYYLYQAAWTDYRKNPMVHIFPYWDFNEGQRIDVRVCSNAPIVELFFNGKSQGVCVLAQKEKAILAGHWQIPYEAGTLYAAARDEEGHIWAEETRQSFGEAVQISLKASETELKADGEDIVFIEISMKDKEGYPVENANNYVKIEVEGAGALVGTDNGDSTDTDEYKSGIRKLFSGKLLAVCKADIVPGEMVVKVNATGMQDAVLRIPVREAQIRKGISRKAYLPEEKENQSDRPIQVRNIKLVSSQGQHLCKENMVTEVTAHICPEIAADQELIWEIVDDAGIPLKIAEVQSEGRKALITAKSDGNFRLRCMSKSGTEKVRIISVLEFVVDGLGKAFTNPYEFVSAGLYDYSKGEIGNGNEHGVATSRDGESRVGFQCLDFGDYGSDEITMQIFALTDDPYDIQIYERNPDEEGILLGNFVYQKPKKWNVYQDAVFQLNQKLKGITELCFVFQAKMHVKGFCFKKYERSWQKLSGEECDSIYGDSFKKKGNKICGIGNNVTIGFKKLNFGTAGARYVTIAGATPLEKTSIVLKFLQNGEEKQCIIEFVNGSSIQRFSIDPLYQMNDVSLVFLPGSKFDFEWIQFEKGIPPSSS